MQNAPLFHVLLEHLESIDAPPMEIQRFVDRWSKLGPHGQLPCPVCFLNGEEQPLVPLNAQGNVEPVVCKACGTRFEFRLTTDSSHVITSADARASLLCYLIVAQLVAKPCTGEWLRTDHLVESGRIWCNANGARFDWRERARLGQMAAELAPQVMETFGLTEERSLAPLFVDV